MMRKPEPGGQPPAPAEFMDRARRRGAERIEMMHHLSKRIWSEKRWTPAGLQTRCMEEWDALGSTLGAKIRPLVPVSDERHVTNLIFGSGSFTTGAFEAAQYQAVARYAPDPPVALQAFVANRSEANGCSGARVSREFHVPLVELDFADWYRECVDGKETNPISATRFWFAKDDPKRPPPAEVVRRFEIRQERFHAALGEKIAEEVVAHTDIASARGYSFALCSALFKGQTAKPHANDTHPADLTFVDPRTKAKTYPGWQSGPVGLMMKNGHGTFRGSLIEVEYMDRVAQIDALDEGALLAIGEGVAPVGPMAATDIQSAMKLVDDYVFCTLEPTGLLLAWGITDRPVPVEFQDTAGNPVIVSQRAIVVGDEVRSGIRAWGGDLRADLEKLERFLFSG